jgi:hypothetical protein
VGYDNKHAAKAKSTIGKCVNGRLENENLSHKKRAGREHAWGEKLHKSSMTTRQEYDWTPELRILPTHLR